MAKATLTSRPFIQTLTVGYGFTPYQPITGCDRVADFTAGSELRRPPEQCGLSLPPFVPVVAAKESSALDPESEKPRFPQQRYRLPPVWRVR